MSGPSQAQIESYRRDGFLVVEQFLASDEVNRVREREAEMIRWLNSPDFSVEGLKKRFGL